MQRIIIGLDEAGNGTWAGPLTAAVVVLTEDTMLNSVRDSKKMSENKREEAVDDIQQHALFWRIGFQTSARIDEDGIGYCWVSLMYSLASMARAKYPDAELIVDGNRFIAGIQEQTPIPKADDKYPCVRAASVLAKYAQCLWMDDYHIEYPEYGFDCHRGYGTKKHMAALKEHGPCRIHRKSYKPIQKIYSQLSG